MKRIQVGLTFGENIQTEKIAHYNTRKARIRKFRGYILPLVLTLIILVLCSKLFYLQILKGSLYRDLSEANRTQTTIIHAPRGVIFDRNKVPLVFNTAGFRRIINGKTQFLTQTQALELLAKNDKNLEIDSLRYYPYKDAFSHVLGYVGQISSEELSSPQYANYSQGDVVGKMGLEAEYQQQLKGVDGKKLLEIDASGRVTRTLGQTDPIAGEDITTTLDSKLQLNVFEAMKNVKKGAAIVSTPNGQILALVSTPAFDPNLFTLGSTYKTATDSSYQNIDQILSDNNSQPLLNRAISGVYPPGSTFKIVNAAAGLEDGVINKDFSLTDTGTITIGAFSFSNWYFTQYGRTDGQVDVVKAIQRSNDIFFYHLADLLGVDRLSAFARKFGLGSTLGIDLPGESSGLVPTKEWKEKTMHEPWYLGDDYHYGIGQGYLLTTPLQVNNWTSTIANGGYVYQPHLVSDKPLEKYLLTKEPILSNQTDNLIRDGIFKVCEPGGVAYPLFNFAVKNAKLTIDNKDVTSVASASADYRHVTIACKTGTAQQGGISENPHAWITIFAPAYKPQIVVTVLSEASGEGSDVAAPIAKKILQYWFTR